MNITVRVLAALAAATIATQSVAQDESAGDAAFDVAAAEALYKKSCRRCHGPTAKGLASFPKLVGQTPEYLADKLERYRAGEKLGPNTGLMAPNAKSLSDEDIANLSHFIASL